MDAAQFEALVQRLIADPHDAEVLARAHDAGQSDPQTYAALLERVGAGANDMGTAAHWFNEAATVWHSIGEPAHYQRLVLAAAERDATNPSVVERAAQLYHEHQDAPGLAHLYERVVAETRQALGEETDPQEVQQLRELLTSTHEQLAYLYAEGQMQDPDASARHWMGLLELEPQHVMAIYHARELFKAQGRWHEALPLFDRELALVDDPDRRHALLLDEAEVRRQAGDLRGATEALRKVSELRPDDPAASYAFATSITERIEQGQPTTAAERTEAAQALVGLAEMYDGEHAFMYSVAALKAEAGHDRAMQLADYHGQTLGRSGELGEAYQGYLLANPGGYMAEGAVQQLAKLGLPVPGRSAPPPPSRPVPSRASGPASSEPVPLRRSGPPPMPSAQSSSEQPHFGQPHSGQPHSGQPHSGQPHSGQPHSGYPAAVPTSGHPSSAPASSAGQVQASEVPSGGPPPVPSAHPSAQPSAQPSSGQVQASEVPSGGPPPVPSAHPSSGQPTSSAVPSAPVPSGQPPVASEPPGGYPGATELRQGYPPAPAPAGGYPAPPAAVGSPAPAPEAQASPEPAEPKLDPDSLEGLIQTASQASRDGKQPQAADAYRRVLALDPTHEEALAWVEDFLRQRRKFGDLRDVLMAAAGEDVPAAERLARLREVAELCEQKLRDHDSAITAYRQILDVAPDDEDTRVSLEKLLEKQKRWDELAPVLEERARQLHDVDAKVAYLTRAAEVHEKWRRDPASAAHSWRAIINAKPTDEKALDKALELYDEVKDQASAAAIISSAVGTIANDDRKGRLLERLGALRVEAGDHGGAGEAYAEAGALLDKTECLDAAAEAYDRAERWADLADVHERRGEKLDGKEKATAIAAAGRARLQAGEVNEGLAALEQASVLDPEDEQLATTIEERYHQAGRHDDQIRFLIARASRVEDRDMRVGLNHRAAAIQRNLGDEEGTRKSLEAVLEDGDDATALRILLEMAEGRQDWAEAVELLSRLVRSASDEDKLGYAIREAQLLADGTGEIDTAIARYERILEEDDPENRYALGAMSDLEMRRGNHGGAADALERLLKLLDGDDEVEVARKLAQLYEGPLEDAEKAVVALEIVHKGDPTDLDSIARLQRMAEKRENWPRVTELLEKLIEVEGDEEEASEMTLKLCRLYADQMEDPDRGLAALSKLADAGDVRCQQAYVDLGIKLERKTAVAEKLTSWNAASAGTSRVDALRRAFALFLESEQDDRARDVALELARSKDCDVAMAQDLEVVATRLRDLSALASAHELIASAMNGQARAEEYVRQAEAMVAAGADPLDAIHHGELGLGGLSGEETMPLMHRLAAVTEAPGHVVDLFERHVQRCRRPQERIAALAAAAQVAAEHGALDRAKEFFDSALAGGIQEETLTSLEAAAREADRVAGGDGRLLRAMAEALAAGGQGSRDGGRTRSALLRRAAAIAHEELNDTEAAFQWLGDSLIAHVDDGALEALERLGEEAGDAARVEAGLSRALDEVYDGPLVRKLLRKRADLRRKSGVDPSGAAADLKRLHDLSPADDGLTKELSKLLIELGDHRGMIELYEDQILRGREAHVRAELARKVARIWEEEIGDAREAADAWRRVLRMKSGDKEATAGLERAKAGKLKKPPPVRGKSMPPGTGTGAPPPSIPAGPRSVPPSRPPGAGQPYLGTPAAVASEVSTPAEMPGPPPVPSDVAPPAEVPAQAVLPNDVSPPAEAAAPAPLPDGLAPPAEIDRPAEVMPPAPVVGPTAEVVQEQARHAEAHVFHAGTQPAFVDGQPAHGEGYLAHGEASGHADGHGHAPPHAGFEAGYGEGRPAYVEGQPAQVAAHPAYGDATQPPTNVEGQPAQVEGQPAYVEAQPVAPERAHAAPVAPPVNAEVQPEAVEPMEVQPEAVEPMEVQPEAVEPMEVQPEAVEPMEVQPEAGQDQAPDPPEANGQSHDEAQAQAQPQMQPGPSGPSTHDAAADVPAYDPQLFQQYVDHYVAQGYTREQAHQYAEYYLVPGAADGSQEVQEVSEDAIELDAGDVEQLDDDDVQIEP